MTDPIRPQPGILDIALYEGGKANIAGVANVVKLSSNENPFGPSDKAKEAFGRSVHQIHRYPSTDHASLRQAIGETHGLDADRVICGVGSDEIIHFLCQAYAGPKDEVVFTEHGFLMYRISAMAAGATPVEVAERERVTDVDAILKACNRRTKLVFIANPNNPTGTYTSRADIARLHTSLPDHVLLVLDHAYAEYLADEDEDGAMALAKTAANVLITRTFSKIYGLAAERVGWGYAAAPIIDAMHRIRAPFGFSIAAQDAAIAALADTDFVAHSRAHNAQWLSWFAEEIGKLGNQGLRAIPSKANFQLVLFEGKVTAEDAYKALMEHGYIVRWLPGQGLANGLRITIGTEAETRGVIAALRQILGADA